MTAREASRKVRYLRQRRIPEVARYPIRDAVFLSFGVATLDLNWASAAHRARNPVHILAAERVKLACKRQGDRIFANGEYPWWRGIPNGMPFSLARVDKKCQPKNPRFSRVFFVLRSFPHFFEIRILVKIKRCQTAFSSKGVEVNL